MSLNLGIIASSRTTASGDALLLDTYTGAAGAYSLRKLRTAYTGAAIRVRRSSDNTETDIGFVANMLDVTTLTTFCGVGDGFIRTWYDQSGNSRNGDAGTSTSAPKIIIGGVLQLQLGKPTVKFITSTICGIRTAYNLTNPFTMIGVLAQDSGANLSTRIFSADNTDNFLTIARVNVTSVYTGTNIVNFPSRVMGQSYLVSFSRQTSTSFIYQNGSIVANSSSSSSNFGSFAMNSTIGAREGVDSRISEVILYANNQNSNISGINSNINSFYSIY
jgi:hypothetical protein